MRRESRTTNHSTAETDSRAFPGRRTIIVAIGLILLAIVGVLRMGTLRAAQPPPTFNLIYPRYDTLTAMVKATGRIEPVRIAKLSFRTTGQVSKVLVNLGDQVSEGMPVAQLDDRELRLKIVQAQAALDQMMASYQKLQDGTSPEQLAVMRAQVAQATGQLRQIEGGVTPADLRAAQAQLDLAQTQLTQLEAGPRSADLRVAEARLQQAQANLATQRTQLSAAKTNGQNNVEQASEALTQAQSSYAVAKQNWDYVQQTGVDPIQPSVPDPRLRNIRNRKPNTLNEAQRQMYYNTYVRAEAALRSAEKAVDSALVSVDSARQNEVTGVKAAEEQVTIAQTELDTLRDGSDAGQLAAARAQVATARANLEKLQGEQRGGALQAAQAALEQSQSQLKQLQASPQPSDLVSMQAQVHNAQAALDLAKLALDSATLIAPFSGTVIEVNLSVGETPNSTGGPALVLADVSRLHVDVAVDEVDVARLAVGQPVTLTLEALPNINIAGAVESISPSAQAQSSISTYQVRVAATANDPRVRLGMTANADIIVNQKRHALLVPRRAVYISNGRRVVDIVKDSSICALPPEQRSSNVDRVQHDVQTGLTNDQMIEITGGLDEHTCVYIEGIDARMNPLAPMPGAQLR